MEELDFVAFAFEAVGNPPIKLVIDVVPTVFDPALPTIMLERRRTPTKLSSPTSRPAAKVRCELCGVSLAPSSMKSHLSSARHKRQEASQEKISPHTNAAADQ